MTTFVSNPIAAIDLRINHRKGLRQTRLKSDGHPLRPGPWVAGAYSPATLTA
jgi:hypothetical protein